MTAPDNIRSALCLQAQKLQNEKQMTTREGVGMKKKEGMVEEGILDK